MIVPHFFLNLLFLFSLLNITFTLPLIARSSHKEDTICLSSEGVTIRSKSHVLATGAYAISPYYPNRLNEWTFDQHRVTYHSLQLIIHCWNKQGIVNYMTYGKYNPYKNNEPFEWQVIPYPSKGIIFFQQFSVLWHILNGPFQQQKRKQLSAAETIQKDVDMLYSLDEPHPQTLVAPSDAFCKPHVIATQSVFEGKTIRILYDYKPIGPENLHFLVVTKKHRSDFSEVTLQEYLEATQLTIACMEQLGLPAYIFDKNGPRAGQSQPHWHRHIIFTRNEKDAFWGKMEVLRKMIIGTFSLSQEEMAQKREEFAQKLGPALEQALQTLKH